MTGNCRFCGQVLYVDELGDPEETATRRCDCSQARDYDQMMLRREEAAKKRAEAEKTAAFAIEGLYGEREYNGKIIQEDVGERVRDLLLHCAMMVYDGDIDKLSLETGGVKCKIAYNPKAHLKFERVDTTTAKREI